MAPLSPYLSLAGFGDFTHTGLFQLLMCRHRCVGMHLCNYIGSLSQTLMRNKCPSITNVPGVVSSGAGVQVSNSIELSKIRAFSIIIDRLSV